MMSEGGEKKGDLSISVTECVLILLGTQPKLSQAENENSSRRISDDENQAQMARTETVNSNAIAVVKRDDIFAFLWFYL